MAAGQGQERLPNQMTLLACQKGPLMAGFFVDAGGRNTKIGGDITTQELRLLNLAPHSES